jgi:hypothetical protein
LEEFKRRAEEAEEKLSTLDFDAPAVTELKTELQEKNVEVGRLRARGD